MSAAENGAATGDLSSSARRHKYEEVMAQIERWLAGGEFAAGERLPEDRKIAKMLGVSRNTVVRALTELRDRERLERVPGMGTFVMGAAPTSRAVFGCALYAREETVADMSIFGSRMESRLQRFLSEKSMGVLRVGGCFDRLVEPGNALPSAEELGPNLRGIFVVPPEEVSDQPDLRQEIHRQLSALSVPVVLFDRDTVVRPDRSSFDLVQVDNLNAGFEIGRHVATCRPGRVVLAAPLPLRQSVIERFNGIRAGFADAARQGVSPEPSYEVCSTDAEALRETILRAKPDVVIGKDDEVAAHVCQVLYDLSLRVPDDVCVAGFDDNPFAARLSPGLTTFHQPVGDLAAAAVELMQTRLGHLDRSPRRVMVRGWLVRRDSTRRSGEPGQR